MNPTEAKFHDDLDSIAHQLELGVAAGNYSWRDVQERLKHRTAAAAKATDQVVHEYTWTTLGIVAGLSALVGYLINRP